MQRILEVYDIEVLSNCFTYTGYVPSEDKYYQFVIWKDRNDYLFLVQHLMRGIYHVGFNNEGYDYPVLHHLLNHFKEYRYKDGWDLTPLIYKKSQEIIKMEYSTVADYNKHIPQLDLYKIWHFNNPARACSLKQLEIAMRMELVEDMPYNHDHHVLNELELDEILSYNKHDVHATYLFFKITKGDTENKLYKGKDKLQLRKDIQKMYNLPCLNMADVKIGEELLLKLYCDETGVDPKKLRKSGGSPRKQINIGECIFPYISFKTKEFRALKDWFASQIITGTNGAFSNLPLENVKSLLPYVDPSTISTTREGEKRLDNVNIKIQDSYIVYGTGGAHQSLCGKFVANKEWTILDIDVGSLYPSIEVQNNLYPEHLGPIFSHIFDKNIVSVRLAEKKRPKKERNPVIMEGFKLAANGSYGKSNEETSFLYDPKYTMSTTINGQLSISMLIESILLESHSLIVQTNTDGLTIKVRRDELEHVLAICRNWEKVTKLMLEYNYYKMMVIVDVSTYLAQYEDDSIKLKNDFEIDKEIYKNPSMRIVPIALKEYFVNNIPVEETIRNHRNIYDFCLMARVNRNFDLYYKYLDKSEVKSRKLSKTLRYFASKSGGILYKCRVNDNTGSILSINAGQTVTLFNQFYDNGWESYNIDYNFYINECMKIINKIEPPCNQLSLF